jgi:hypothetical protein
VALRFWGVGYDVLILEEEGSKFLRSLSVTTHPLTELHLRLDLNPQSFSYNENFISKDRGVVSIRFGTVVSFWKIAAGKYRPEMSAERQTLCKVMSCPRPLMVYIFLQELSAFFMACNAVNTTPVL